MRGIYLDGIVLDEYADMDPRVWSEIIRPALADRQGLTSCTHLSPFGGFSRSVASAGSMKSGMGRPVRISQSAGLGDTMQPNTRMNWTGMLN